MEYKAQKIGTVKGLGDIYQVAAPLDEQLKAFADIGIRTLAAPDEVAKIRLAGVSTDYSRTSIAPIAIKGGNTILVRNSLLMNPLLASTAIRARRNGRYFTMDKEIYEEAEACAKSQESMPAEDRSMLIVSRNGDFDITPQMNEAQFILRKQNEPYFSKFTNGIIPFYNFSADSKNRALVNYLWFNGPQSGSLLGCWYWGLNYGDRAFWVLVTGEASAQEIMETYTPRQITLALKELKLSGLENTLLEALKEKH